MKLRHGAVLIIIGCYLLFPPIKGDHVDVEAPLIRWEKVDHFESDDDCRRVQAIRVWTDWVQGSSDLLERDRFRRARCVWDGDPDLFFHVFQTPTTKLEREIRTGAP